MQRKVLITGAAGRIGSYLTRHMAGMYDLVLTDVREPSETHGAQFYNADIGDLDALQALFIGVDTVIHLAADPSTHAPWESLLPRNIVGAYHVFEAARVAGCRRVVFASSVNAVNGYPTETQVHTDMPVRPGNLYGATKVWGEVLGRLYADQHSLSSICLRFGAVVDLDNNTWMHPGHPFLDIVLTYADLARLVVASVEAPDDLRFGVFHGVSNNRWKRLDISDARTLIGYEPQDDAFKIENA